jgi:hypothetical protein
MLFTYEDTARAYSLEKNLRLDKMIGWSCPLPGSSLAAHRLATNSARGQIYCKNGRFSGVYHV